jgi:putative ABC transport system permease protein
MSSLLARLLATFHRRQINDELADEMSAHLEFATADNVARGMSPNAALRAATLKFGGALQTAEAYRDVIGFPLLESGWQDVRYACRLLRKTPVFTLVAAGTLALGIGANTAMFSIVDSVLLRQLPYADPARLVMLWEDASVVGYPKNSPAPGNYMEWRQRSHSFVDVAATQPVTAILSGDGTPEQVLGRNTTASFFPVLGVSPLLGRTFTDTEDQTGAPVVVMSYALWRRHYGSDPSAIGRLILLNDSRYQVIGVMPEAFMFQSRDVDYWVPMHFTPAQAVQHSIHYLNVVARLKPGVTLSSARADMTSVSTTLQQQFPDTNSNSSTVVIPLRDDLLGNTRLELMVLMAAAASTLLIACANLASLLLSRAAGRRGELALRVALGATRGRMVRQMIIEGITLSLVGGVLGLAVPPLALSLLGRVVPTGVNTTPFVLDWRILTFSFVVSVATGLLFSIVPALQSARTSVRDALQQNVRGAVGGSSGATRDTLVVLQVATTLVLLVAAGLMLRTLSNLRAIDVGFRSDHLLTMRTTLPQPRYSEPAKRSAFYERVLAGVRVLPGIEHAAYGSVLPFVQNGNSRPFAVEGRPTRPGELPDALYRVGTSDYLETLGVRLIDGRLIDGRDIESAQLVAVINETMARQYWPTESAVGKRIMFGPPDVAPKIAVIGVVKDVHESGYQVAMKPEVYVPASQARPGGPENLIVRVSGDPSTYARPIARVVAEVDPTQPVAAVRTMDEIIDLNVGDRHQQMVLLVAFGGLALLLVSLGLYGVLAQGVAARTREIGLRIALGATRHSVMTMVIARGVTLTAIGAAVGVAAAWGLTRAMSILLYGVGAADPVTFAGVAALLCVVALIACAVPAVRAAHVDPMLALRDQ